MNSRRRRVRARAASRQDLMWRRWEASHEHLWEEVKLINGEFIFSEGEYKMTEDGRFFRLTKKYTKMPMPLLHGIL